ncbi:MAG: hypothetical protein K9L79_00520 [Methylobacter tundripaludum]|nr:hypothetical protein [Methylobacter tundripaludum]
MSAGSPDWQQRAKRTYQAIKAYYLKHNGKDWSKVSADPRLFNRVWRRMLKLPAGDMPPPNHFKK